MPVSFDLGPSTNAVVPEAAPDRRPGQAPRLSGTHMWTARGLQEVMQEVVQRADPALALGRNDHFASCASRYLRFATNNPSLKWNVSSPPLSSGSRNAFTSAVVSASMALSSARMMASWRLAQLENSIDFDADSSCRIANP